MCETNFLMCEEKISEKKELSFFGVQYTLMYGTEKISEKKITFIFWCTVYFDVRYTVGFLNVYRILVLNVRRCMMQRKKIK